VATHAVTVMRNPFTPQNQAKIQQWISDILFNLPTTGTGPVGFGIDTNGNSIIVEEYVGDCEDIELGTFHEGWITQPAKSAECPNCNGEQPTLVHGNPERDIILMDCLNCRTRLRPDGEKR